jgi:SAM-dependent methyltransferase
VPAATRKIEAGRPPAVRTFEGPDTRTGSAGRVGAVDWGAGSYEQIAVGLLPAALTVIEHAAPQAGERVVDVGCGTGNAALLAAGRGAHVTGVDPAQRLLQVARARAAGRCVDANFTPGDATALPLADGIADLVLSVFGVIFAHDAAAAAAEIARVTAARGRIVLCAWIPGGALAEAMELRREAIAGAQGRTAGPPAVAWHDPAALEGMFAPHGFTTTAIHEHTLLFIGSSPREFTDSELRDHPLWVDCRSALEARGGWQTVRDRAFAIFEAANEDPAAFRVTSRYVVATLRRE